MNMTHDIGDVVMSTEDARIILGYDTGATNPLRWRAETEDDYRLWTTVLAHRDIPYGETFASMVNIAKERGAKSIHPIYATDKNIFQTARTHRNSMVGIMWSKRSLPEAEVAGELKLLNEWMAGQVFELTIQTRARYLEGDTPVWEHVETIGDVYENDIDERARDIMQEFEEGVIA